MNRSEVTLLARKLMSQHGVGHIPFKLTGGKRQLGVCRFHPRDHRGVAGPAKEIGLSSYWIQVLEPSEVEDIILHEIAHAKAGHAAGHSMTWRLVARSIGANGDRCHTPTDAQRARMNALVPHAWVGTCPRGHTREMHRAPTSVRTCALCSPKFNMAHLFTYTNNGVPVPESAMPEKYRLSLAQVRAGRGTTVRRKRKTRTLEDMFSF